MFNLVNKTLKIKSEKFSPCDLFIYRYDTGGTIVSILHINNYSNKSYCFLEDIAAYRNENGEIFIKGSTSEISNFHIRIAPIFSTAKVSYEIIDGIVDTSSFVRLEKK